MEKEPFLKSSNDSLSNSEKVAKEETVSYFKKKGKLELATGAIGLQALQDNQDSHRKNREAEEAHARKTIWGWESQTEDDDMSRNIDISEHVHPPAVVYPPQQSQQSSLWPAVGLALASMIPTAGAAGVVGYMLNNDNTTVAVPSSGPDRDSTYKIEKWIPGNPKE